MLPELNTNLEKTQLIDFTLSQNYPNPFNSTTTIQYDLPKESLVNIIIYDMLGKRIKTISNLLQTAGYHEIKWSATNNQGNTVVAGIYFYTIEAGKFRQTKKMVFLK